MQRERGTILTEKLDIQTEPGRKLFQALQDYGTYFTEDATWDVWDIIVERGVEIEFEKTHGFSMKSKPWRDDVNRLMTALYVMVNTSSQSIGRRGGLLVNLSRRPLAKHLSEYKDCRWGGYNIV